MKIRTLGMFVNRQKKAGLALIPRVESACSAAGVALLAESAVPGAAPVEVFGNVDAVLVLGGDGTILRTVARMGNHRKPVLGVNLGTLGFLAECMPDQLALAIARLAAGEYWLEERMLLHARMEDEDSVVTALNDVVISRGSFSHMIHVDTYVDGALCARYEGDGAIVASPTGSTAYSLSVGGPVVAPDLNCFVLAPISPHTLSSRPLVVSASSRVRMEVTPREEDGGMLLSVDGSPPRILRSRSALHVRRCSRSLPFVRFGENRFYALLQSKLSQWGGAMPPDES